MRDVAGRNEGGLPIGIELQGAVPGIGRDGDRRAGRGLEARGRIGGSLQQVEAREVEGRGRGHCRPASPACGRPCPTASQDDVEHRAGRRGGHHQAVDHSGRDLENFSMRGLDVEEGRRTRPRPGPAMTAKKSQQQLPGVLHWRRPRRRAAPWTPSPLASSRREVEAFAELQARPVQETASRPIRSGGEVRQLRRRAAGNPTRSPSSQRVTRDDQQRRERGPGTPNSPAPGGRAAHLVRR